MKDIINKNWFGGVTTVATIVMATFYLEDRISATIKDAVNPINYEVNILKDKVKVLEDKVLIYSFKVDAYEKYFTKPKETKLENEN